MENTKISNACIAEIFRVDHPESSYGIFCFNSDGDLFLNSDYGFHAYVWRAFNGSFKSFLGQCNSDYIVGKFEITYNEMARRKMPKHMVGHLKNLVNELINYCKKEQP